MTTARAAFALIYFLAALAGSGGAAAHQMNLSTARIELSPDGRVTVEIALKGSDVDRVAGTEVFENRTGLVDPLRLAASAARIEAYLAAHLSVSGGSGACRPGPVALTSDADGVVGRTSWSCGPMQGVLVYRSTVLVDVDPAARQIALVGTGPAAYQALLDATHTEVTLTAPPPSLPTVVGRYILAGIEHIFLGYDHIAFLIAVVLWADRIWPVIKIVTAFTLAHSITLSLAALRIVVVPSAIIEPAIAASIVFVAVENFFSRDIDRRWRDTLGFGLIHGFGFASALQEFGLPRDSLLPALGAFNLGVEIGQVAIVSIVIPAIVGIDRLVAAFLGRRPARAAPLVYAASGVIACLGGWWVLERTLLA